MTVVQKRDIPADGALGVKVGWYRYGRGKLTITATRLDKQAGESDAHPSAFRLRLEGRSTAETVL